MVVRAMTGKIIAFCNRKGGVGKTTSTICMAHTFQTQHRRRTVVVDTDPQASASLSLAGREMLDQALPELTLERLLQSDILDARKPDPGRLVRRNVSAMAGPVPLGLVPITPRFWKLEAKVRRETVGATRRAVVRRFRKLLHLLAREFDYVLVDTAPGQGLLFEHVVRAADCLLIPCVPDQISAWGLDVVKEELGELSLRSALAWVIWTQFDPRTHWQDRVRQDLEPNLPFPCFRAPGRSASDGESVQYLGIGQYNAVPHAVTNTGATTFETRYPEQVRNDLVRISNVIAAQLGGFSS
jgi:chromosome partitioning protein